MTFQGQYLNAPVYMMMFKELLAWEVTQGFSLAFAEQKHGPIAAKMVCFHRNQRTWKYYQIILI